MSPGNLRPGMMFLNSNEFTSSSSFVISIVGTGRQGEFTITFLDIVICNNKTVADISVENHEDGLSLFGNPWVQVV